MNLTIRQIRSLLWAIKTIDAGCPKEVKDDNGQERVANLPFKLPTKVRYSLARNQAIFDPLVSAFEKTIQAKLKEAGEDPAKLAQVEADGQELLDETEELAKVFTISESDYENELCAQPIPATALGELLKIVGEASK